MLLRVVPARPGAGLGVGGALALEEEVDGGGVGVPDGPEEGAEELLEPEGAELDALAGSGAAIVVPAGPDAVPPHPPIIATTIPNRPALRSKRGTEGISQF